MTAPAGGTVRTSRTTHFANACTGYTLRWRRTGPGAGCRRCPQPQPQVIHACVYELLPWSSPAKLSREEGGTPATAATVRLVQRDTHGGTCLERH